MIKPTFEIFSKDMGEFERMKMMKIRQPSNNVLYKCMIC